MNINVKLVSAIVIGIMALVGLYFLKKRKVSFSARTLVALALGISFGFIFKESALVVEPIGTAYVALVRMLVIPLVMVSLISSISGLEDANKLKTMGIKALTILIGTTGIAGIVGIIFGNVFKVGQGISYEGAADFVQREVPSFAQVFNDMLPSNPIKAMAEGKIIPVIIFSLFIAFAIIIEDKNNRERVKPFKDLINSISTILIRITRIILQLTPYGVFALMSGVAAKNGISTFMPLAKFIVAVYAALIFQIIVVHGGLILAIKRSNPFKFFKAIYPAQVVAFTTQSSFGTLPVTIETLEENAGVSNTVASFVGSLGSTVGMNGCGGVYPAMVAIFVANVFGIELTMTHYILLIVTTMIGSLGIAGVPGAATMSTTLILTTLGLPIEGLAIVLGIDVILDMMRTMTNVTGSAVAAYLVDTEAK